MIDEAVWDTCIGRSIGERVDSTLICILETACMDLEEHLFKHRLGDRDEFSLRIPPFRDEILCKLE